MCQFETRENEEQTKTAPTTFMFAKLLLSSIIRNTLISRSCNLIFTLTS